MRAGHGFTFWISNLKVTCLISYVVPRTQVFLNGEKGKIMFEERWQSEGRQPHLPTLGVAQPFSCSCYCKTTKEQNFSANGNCFFYLPSDGSFRERKRNHRVGWILTFREKSCPVPNSDCGRSKTVMLLFIISGNGSMCWKLKRLQAKMFIPEAEMFLQIQVSCRYRKEWAWKGWPMMAK